MIIWRCVLVLSRYMHGARTCIVNNNFLCSTCVFVLSSYIRTIPFLRQVRPKDNYLYFIFKEILIIRMLDMTFQLDDSHFLFRIKDYLTWTTHRSISEGFNSGVSACFNKRLSFHKSYTCQCQIKYLFFI